MPRPEYKVIDECAICQEPIYDGEETVWQPCYVAGKVRVQGEELAHNECAIQASEE